MFDVHSSSPCPPMTKCSASLSLSLSRGRQLFLLFLYFFVVRLFMHASHAHATHITPGHPNVDTYIALRSLIVRFCVACGWLVSFQRVSYLSGVGGCRQICKFWLCDGPHKNLMGREQEALCAETWAKTLGKYVGRFDQPPKLSTMYVELGPGFSLQGGRQQQYDVPMELPRGIDA